MNSFQSASLSVLCAATVTMTVFAAEPVSAQVYYAQPAMVAPAYPLPSPNYVVYSPNFLAWRSAGYYAGNWGPYYYDPPALYPVIPANMIQPIRVDARPPVIWLRSR